MTVPIIIEETDNIDRKNEPVTAGIPFPRGAVQTVAHFRLKDPDAGDLPLQAEPLATWPDQSLKWVLFDFQVSVDRNQQKTLALSWDKGQPAGSDNGMRCDETELNIRIYTGAAEFSVNKKAFKPFDRVKVRGEDVLDGKNSTAMLTDASGAAYQPVIKKVFWETSGPLRRTLKTEGVFSSDEGKQFADFFSRAHFFANQAMVKIEFTVLNPKAAKHPGGLWDLGDPGSVFFKDLSIKAALNASEQATVKWALDARCDVKTDNYSGLSIYQDSSGGENWHSRNHVNRDNGVATRFRGYRVYSGDAVIDEGCRARPTVSVKAGDREIGCAVQYFWQNFPKALDVHGNAVIVGLFPKYFGDVFELQGGEQKTHTVFLNFGQGAEAISDLGWIDAPLVAHATPEWYAETGAIPYLAPIDRTSGDELLDVINVAIEGDNTFFHRREIIDEYGWRNFGDLYADHEAVGHEGPDPLISHYNNQYDCIYGMLMQFLGTGDLRWFVLADQLCGHVKDIDIYHTDEDRPEYNHGMFWHTEHYIDAQTATHRCFSRRHENQRDLKTYGGGPSLSHNYSTGLLYHYYLTGSPSSQEAILELAKFINKNIEINDALSIGLIKKAKQIVSLIKEALHGKELVKLNKVYGLDGPGRASGNSLNTLINAYILTNDEAYMEIADDLICRCVHPFDDINKRDLLDIENRWMYTVFLQSLGKYLDVKTETAIFDDMWRYAKATFFQYAKWMVENEGLYLDKPDRLEFPNETWACQEFRKCNILLFAARYCKPEERIVFEEKASYFYQNGVSSLHGFRTKHLTRPLSLILQNGIFKVNSVDCLSCWDNQKSLNSKFSKSGFKKVNKKGVKALKNFSVRKEIEIIKWRFRA